MYFFFIHTLFFMLAWLSNVNCFLIKKVRLINYANDEKKIIYIYFFFNFFEESIFQKYYGLFKNFKF